MDNELVKKASGIIDDIRSHQKTNTDRLSNLNRQIEDLKTAQKMLVEAQQKPVQTVSGSADTLDTYCEKDGSVRLVSERKMVNTPNGTTPVNMAGLLDDDPVCEWQQDLQRMAEDRQLLRMLQRNPHTPKTDLKIYRHIQKAPRNIRAALQKAYSDSAGAGAEFIPDSFIPSMWESFKVASTLADNFETVTQGVDNKTLLIPRLDRAGRPYIRSAVTDTSTLTLSTISTAQASITVPSFASAYRVDTDAMEDTGFSVLPALRTAIISDIVDGFEDCMINGDTTSSHGDTGLSAWDIRGRWGGTDLGTSADHRRAFTGFRHQAFDRSSASAIASNTLNYDRLMELRLGMSEYGADDLMLIVSPEALIGQLFEIDELVTVDKFGPSAIVLTGQIASVAGMPVVVSRFMGNEMNASGVYDNVTKATTGVLLVSRSSYKIYERKALTVEQSKNIAVGALEIVASYRAICASADAAAKKNVAYGYDLT